MRRNFCFHFLACKRNKRFRILIDSIECFHSFRVLFVLWRGQCVKFSNELIFQNRTPLNGKKEKRGKKAQTKTKLKENIKTAEYYFWTRNKLERTTTTKLPKIIITNTQHAHFASNTNSSFLFWAIQFSIFNRTNFIILFKWWYLNNFFGATISMEKKVPIWRQRHTINVLQYKSRRNQMKSALLQYNGRNTGQYCGRLWSKKSNKSFVCRFIRAHTVLLFLIRSLKLNVHVYTSGV